MVSSTVRMSSASANSELSSHHDVSLSVIEQEDSDFFQALSSSLLQNIPPPGDVDDTREMRQRVQEVHRQMSREPMSKRIFTPASISVNDIDIVYQNDNAFSVRVYDPAIQSPENQSLRPAVITYHGGGWTHGLPQMDEGKFPLIRRRKRILSA